MEIRKYNNATDREAVLDLLRLNTPEYFSETEENDLIYYLDNEAQYYYVLEVDGEVLGCGGFNFTDDMAEGRISWDIFHPAHQGKGLGGALTRFRIDRLKEYAGVKTISVRTSQMAFKFYEKFGFNLKETVKDYWAEGYDLYRMEFSV